MTARTLVVGASFLSSFAVATISHADDKRACIAAFEKATDLRAGHHYVEARQSLLYCGGRACPSDVQTECAKELESLEASMPSVVLVARDEQGHDHVRGRALLDGVPVPLDGRALTADPGRHTVRFEVEGCAPSEEEVVFVEGERNRPVAGRLHCSAAPVAADASPSPPPAHEDAGPDSGSPNRVLPITLGAVGVLGIAAWAYLGGSGKNEIEDIRATGCAPNCDHDAVMSARRKLLVGDIVGVAGLAALGAAVWLTFARPTAPAAPKVTRLRIAPERSGGSVVLDGRF